MPASPRILHPQPLTSQAFASYGEVVEHQGAARRHYLTEPMRHGPDAIRNACWVSRLDAPATRPVSIELMERHRYAAQTFVPLSGAPYLVVVAPTGPDDLPDMDRLQAFLASGRQGVCYRVGTWHHGLTVLAGPAEFLVMMGQTGRNDDDEFWRAPAPHIVVSLPD
ncbi:ureidoglycolate lyase [Achromobacter sp. NPDC058515]|uniref:ureidoglycolate lyase n=1 Tax=Achromobacter sp. NPDC058515 TaxID=3346533 RepID=UPI0036571DF2